MRVTPEKGSNPRTLDISDKLAIMLNRLPRNDDYVFNHGFLNHFRDNFRQQRKRLSTKLEDPKLDQITFKTLRHYKATTYLRRTNNIMKVKVLLGHKSVKNTEIYTHLIDCGENDDYDSQVAQTTEEARKFIEVGFDFVCLAPDGFMIFRRRK